MVEETGAPSPTFHLSFTILYRGGHSALRGDILPYRAECPPGTSCPRANCPGGQPPLGQDVPGGILRGGQPALLHRKCCLAKVAAQK